MNIDDFQILNNLGKGNFGEVFLAEKKINGEKCAIKTCRKFINGIDVTSYSYNEISFLTKIQHPNVIKIEKFFEDDNYIYIILEYFESNNCKKYIGSNERIPLFCIQKIIETVKYIHDKGYIHGDLNLENILINREQKIKIIDFGLSRLSSEHSDKIQGIVGQFMYQSPEVLKHCQISEASDLWSLGIIVFIFLTGKFPFEGNNIHSLYLRISEKKINYEKYNLTKSQIIFFEKILSKKVEKRRLIQLE